MVNFENGNIKISVRNLVEFILREGDIDNRYAGSDKESMLEGARIHKKIQRMMGSTYQAEVPLKITIEYENFNITVQGRADGIITPLDVGEDKPDAVIDEIKSMHGDVNKLNGPVMVHKAQAMCYGYIYGIQNDLELIGIRMTYVNIEDEDIKYFEENYTLKQLKEWFNNLICEYYKWAEFVYLHSRERNQSAKELQFPFDYRPGQKKMAASVYKSIEQGRELYIQAPTGVGKTMSVIFPSVKSMGEGMGDKIFYLTAKTITGTVAHQAYNLLRKNGLKIKSIAIVAKEKMCILDETDCNPVACQRAKGHFDRVNSAIFDMICHEDDISRETTLKYAEKYNVCPFEMCLDASYFADAIVCDYNYAFDPKVRLKRYFSDGSKGDYIFLVDEAHNLVDRAREMYSATLHKEKILQVKRIIAGRDKRTTGSLEKCNRNMLEKKRELGNNSYMELDSINDLVIRAERAYGYLESLLEVYKEFQGRDIVLDFFFELSNFLSVFETMDECYRIVAQLDDEGDFSVRLMCINPSHNLKTCMGQARSTIMYSGTFLPINYYKYLLTGDKEDYAIYIDSPFSAEKRLIAMADDISTKYTRRCADEYEKIADYIFTVISIKRGNYMIFFPSYKFMNDIKDIFLEKYVNNNINVISQSSGMNESEREEFLEMFSENNTETLAAFCVMGGIFSEGIDLVNEKLIGTIVVGTGFPQVCMEREIIKKYFDENAMNGFDYSYRYPGMNKVLQAAGRVIRTVDDVGVIVLLDDRFLQRDYTGLFPREWQDRKRVNICTLKDEITKFWNNNEKKTE